MYYKLKENLILRGWTKLPYAICNKINGQTFFLTENEFQTVSLCNGQIDIDSFFILPIQKEIIKNLEKNGLVEKCEKGNEILEEQKYKLYNCRYIYQAHWSITGKCNFKCKHCYLSAPHSKFGELSHETCINIIKQLAECGIMNVSITGGEPLYRSDFIEIIDELLKNKINISQIYSNAALINDELLDKLESRGIKPEFSISFDGIGWHDWIRGIKGAEKMAINAFKLLNKRGFPIDVEMCIHKNNSHTLEETINTLAQLGVNSIKTNPVHDTGEWTKEKGIYNLTTKELYDIYLDYIPKFFKAGSPLTIHLGGFFICEKGQKDYIIPAIRFDGSKTCKNQTICGHARNVMYIGPDGQLLPCMPLAGLEINGPKTFITEMPLHIALNNSNYISLIDTRLDEFLKKNKKCNDCDYKFTCGGGCRAGALMSTGDYFGCDESICTLFKDGYIDRIKAVSSEAINSMKM